MTRRSPRWSSRPLGLFLATYATLRSEQVRADWPSARHDAKRTGLANGKGDLTTPDAYWKYFLGGTLNAAGLIVTDVDGDGSQELVVASGDGVAAKRPQNGDVVWSNDEIRFGSLDGLADLDGDGAPELIVHTNARAYVLRPSDGKTLWAEAAGEMGTLSAVRIGDLSGDGRADLVIHECGCCSINSGKSAVAYRFSGAGATLDSPTLMWTPPTPFCGGSQSATLAHMRDPKKLDFVFGTGDHLELLDGASGAVVAAMPTFGVAVQASRCSPIDIDADGRDELLCVLIDTSGIPNNGRRAYLLKYVVDPEPKLKVVWQTLVGTEDGNVRIPASFLGDLDGDGSPEFVLAGKNAQGAWASFVFDATSGSLRARLDDKVPVGIAPVLEGNANALLLAEGSALSAWQLKKDGSVVPRWVLAAHTAPSTVEFEAGQRSSIVTRLLTLDFDGDGLNELVTTTSDGRALELIRTSTGSLDAIGSYALPENVSLVGTWRGTADTPLAIAQSDGNAHLLDAKLAPLSGNADFGARFGGYYASAQFRLLTNHPVLGSLGDDIPGILAVNSRGSLLRLDAREATFAVPPKVRWSRARTQAPQIASSIGGDLARGILAVEKHPGASDHVVALDPEGIVKWDRELPGVVLTDLSSGNLDGSGARDVVVEHGDPGDSFLRITALSGTNGSVLWEAEPVGPGNRQPPGGSLTDWNGDGIDDFVFEYGRTRILDGKTGKLLTESPLGGDYYSPLAYDVDGDGKEELSLYAGYTPAATIAHALDKYLWQGQADDRPLTYGAMAKCDSGAILLGGSWSVPARLSRIVASTGETTTQVLADGGSFADLAAAGAAPKGQLASPAVHENLMGDGRAIAVVGSADGYAYGVEACSGALRFAHRIGAPVGAVAFGKTSSDSESDAIVVSAADGYLYAVRQQALPAVKDVRDLDPSLGAGDTDVDALETREALYAAWSPVAGATSYEVAVVRDPLDGGGFVTEAVDGAGGAGGTAGATNPWRDVGSETQATLSPLALEDGHRYFVAVRALDKTQGLVSPDASSDGVRVTFGEPGRGGGGGAGGGASAPVDPVWVVGRSCASDCSTGGRTTPGASLWSGLVLASLLARRRTSNRLPRSG